MTLTCLEANQHARWQLITKDLEFVESQLIILLGRVDKHRPIVIDRRDAESMIIKSLAESAIVGYIKCFNQTKGRRVKLEVNKLFSTQDGKKYLELHTFVRELRDSYISHAGISNHEGSNMIATIDPAPQQGQRKETVVAQAYFVFPQINIIEMLAMVRFVLKQHSNELQSKLNTFCNKVVDNPEKYNIESDFFNRN